MLNIKVIGLSDIDLFEPMDTHTPANIFVAVEINGTREVVLFQSDTGDTVKVASEMDGAEDVEGARNIQGLTEQYAPDDADELDLSEAQDVAQAAYDKKIGEG